MEVMRLSAPLARDPNTGKEAFKAPLLLLTLLVYFGTIDSTEVPELPGDLECREQKFDVVSFLFQLFCSIRVERMICGDWSGELSPIFLVVLLLLFDVVVTLPLEVKAFRQLRGVTASTRVFGRFSWFRTDDTDTD